MRSTCYEDLPLEIGGLILNYITRPSDLKSLCLVSKRTFELTIPYLYKEVRIPYLPEDPEWTRVSRLAQSPNIHHVRSIEIGRHHIAKDQYCKHFHQLVEKLPPHSLTRFAFDSRGRPQGSDLLQLWRSQPTLQDLQFNFWFNSPPLQDLVRIEQDVLRNLRSITTVNIDFGGESNPILVQRFLNLINTSKLRDAKVACLFGKVSEDYGVPSAGIDQLFNWLPNHLTCLSLSQINLPDPRYWRLGDYSSLRRLRLRYCQHVAPILNDDQIPPLRDFLVELDEKAMRLDFDACTNFIERAKRLETLIIGNKLMTFQWDAVAAALSTHPKGLRTLMVDFLLGFSCGEASWYEQLDGSQLRQLAGRLGDSPNTQLTICKCQEILGMLPNLEVLNVFHTSSDAMEQRQWKDQSIYKIATQVLTNGILEDVPVSHPLKVLAFGKQYYFGDTLQAQSCRHPTRQCYLRARTAENCAKNNEVLGARRIDPGELRYYYPKSDILYYRFDLIAEEDA